MAPVVESFPVSELATRAQYVANGKRRKPPVDLKDCELKEMMAFNCDLNGPQSDPRSRVKCESIMRTFRVCSNKFTVETTEWEGVWDQ